MNRDADQNGLGLDRWGGMTINHLTWDELKHCLEIGNLESVGLAAGQVIVKTAEKEMESRDSSYAISQRTQLGIEQLKIAQGLFEDGRVAHGLKRMKHGMELLNAN